MRGHEEENDYILEGKVFAMLGYLSILCIIPLILKKENRFVLKHAKQGLVIFVAEVAVFILHILLGVWVFKIGMFICGVASFIGILASLRGHYVKLPFVSEIARSIHL